MGTKLGLGALSIILLNLPGVEGQQVPADAPLTLTLQQALRQARQYSAQIQTADITARIAHEDTKQARAAALPSVNGFNQYIYTEGNGTPSGVFVANDGVHVYNEQLQAHEELLAFVRRGEIRLAAATEAVARAKADVAARGLNVTVIQDFYAIASAQRKIANAQTALDEANRFLDITRKQEARGEAAHADSIKAQIQVEQRQRDIQDAQFSAQKVRLALAVLIFPKLRTDYSVADDASEPASAPQFSEMAIQAEASNPDLRAAKQSIKQARLGVSVARDAYLPSLGLDVFYGINANQFAARTDYPTPESGRSTLPNFLVPTRQNLGYSAQATLNIPLWNWGSTNSKVKQAKLKEEQANLDLTTTQKQLEADIQTASEEAQTAFAQLASLHSSSELSAESLRLTLLRYQAGEATALEVSDAQTTVNQARTAYDDGLVRYRVALAAMENLTGTL